MYNSVLFLYQTDRSVTEFDLQRVFSPFGLVLDVIVKDCVIDNTLGQQYGYAFVHYVSGRAGLEAAMEAMNQLNHMTFDGITLHIELSRNISKPGPAAAAFPAANMPLMGGNMGQMGRSMNFMGRGGGEFYPSSRKMHPGAGYGAPHGQMPMPPNFNMNFPPAPPVSVNSGLFMQPYYRQQTSPTGLSATSRNAFAPPHELNTMTSGDSLDSSSWVAERQSFYSASATSSVITDERDDNLSYATWSLGTNLLGGSTTAPPSVTNEVPKSFGENLEREDMSSLAFSSLCVSPPQLPLNHDA